MSTNMSDQKFCIDCKYFQWGYGAGKEACARPVSDELDPVYGCALTIDKRPPHEIRKDRLSCGPAAIFFERKPDLVQEPKPAEVKPELKREPPRKWWQFWL